MSRISSLLFKPSSWYKTSWQSIYHHDKVFTTSVCHSSNCSTQENQIHYICNFLRWDSGLHMQFLTVSFCMHMQFLTVRFCMHMQFLTVRFCIAYAISTVRFCIGNFLRWDSASICNFLRCTSYTTESFEWAWRTLTVTRFLLMRTATPSSSIYYKKGDNKSGCRYKQYTSTDWISPQGTSPSVYRKQSHKFSVIFSQATYYFPFWKTFFRFASSGHNWLPLFKKVETPLILFERCWILIRENLSRVNYKKILRKMIENLARLQLSLCGPSIVILTVATLNAKYISSSYFTWNFNWNTFYNH